MSSGGTWLQETELREILAQHFSDVIGSHAELSALPGERDLNALVTTREQRAVLKIYQPRQREWLELQDRALRHLQSRGVPSPIVLHPDLVDLPGGRVARLISWVDGQPWSQSTTDAAHLTALGTMVSQVDRCLGELDLSADELTVLTRPFGWNMLQAGSLLDSLPLVADDEVREACASVLNEFVHVDLPRLARLRKQLIHNDANEYNIIVDESTVTLIDFGDIVLAPPVVGLATAMSYAAIGKADAVDAIVPLVRGYHLDAPLGTDEVDLLFPLMKVRLAMSVVNSAVQYAADPANDYLLISQGDIPRLLLGLCAMSPSLVLAHLRDACGFEPSPTSRAVRAFLQANQGYPVVAPCRNPLLIDWSIGSTAPRSAEYISSQMALAESDVAVGRYGEDRDVYTDEAFTTGKVRTVHLGLDLFRPAGSPVYAAYDGVIEAYEDRSTHLDYGPVVILRHETNQGVPFWSLYGHLSRESMKEWQVGRRVLAGDEIATIGSPAENVGWPPHVHLQFFTDLCSLGTGVPGVANRDEVSVWRSICPNPNLALGLATGTDAHARPMTTIMRDQRSVRLSRNLSLNFRSPLHIVSGDGAYLVDVYGNRYLDLVNNVAHVGHGNPYVVEVGARQMATLNTNTRYLHNSVLEYARNLAATLPDPLSVVFLVNSGSEANDLAIRLARAHTGARGWISLEHAYHGHTASVIDISPYKFLGKGGAGTPSHVRVASLPDAFRGEHSGPTAGAAYAADFARTLESLDQPLAAFIAEAIVSTAGQVTLAEGFLAAAYAQTRAAGGICIADEVQIGLGRVGEKFWGFELHDVVPDIVTMGKPLGNGHPLAAVVTTPQIAASFHNGMEYFNTFGGNPVSASIGQAVLDVVYDQRLQAHAVDIGAYLIGEVRSLARTYPMIADVRGHGLFIGIELMRDGSPATSEVADVIEYARNHGVLLSSDGPGENVFKIKPPLILTRQDVDLFLEVFQSGLHSVRG